MSRVILFAEVPHFYAAVERADEPSLADRPIIVGGDPRKRGLVQGASAEALAAGVMLDQPVHEALKLCPEARAVRTNMKRYREVSGRLFVCLRRGFDRLEPFGLGAAYLDVTSSPDPPEEIASRLRRFVAEELGLELRAGIAAGKFHARLAAEEAGASGCYRVDPERQTAFLSPLPVTRLEGVGAKTAAALAELGAQRIGQLLEIGPERLQQALGTHGLRIHAYAAGRDDRPVRAARHPQSLSRETTLEESRDFAVLTATIEELARRLEGDLRAQGLTAGRLALKIRFSDRSTNSRSQTLATPISFSAEIQELVVGLLAHVDTGSRPVRGVGIQLGRLQRSEESDRQLDLFTGQRRRA
ncbi:MAG: DNA polymerase IV [Deltaproteobacteria bacterium]|jgi:nucleotidyltransferase/DNA polymerase involved in DNA repair|nr:DNA polymerase IV [Deltaproteobacteria bacterium]